MPTSTLKYATIDPISPRIPMVVKATGLSSTKIYELIADGEIETAKVGRATVVFVESVRGFLDRNRSTPIKRSGIHARFLDFEATYPIFGSAGCDGTVSGVRKDNGLSNQ